MHGTVQVRMRRRETVLIPHAYVMLVILSLINLFNFMDRVLFSVLLEPIKLELSLTDSQMGLIGGVAFGILYGVVGIAAGRLADTRNRVTVLAGALALWSAASALCGQAQSFAQMFAARGAVGVGVSGCSPSAHSLIGDYFPPERRSLALSIFTGIGTAGTMIGLVLGGLLLEAYGWRASFVVFGIAGMLFAPVAWLLLKEPPRGAFETNSLPAGAWGQSIRVLLGRPTVRNLLFGMPMVMAAGGVATWIPAFLQRAHSASAADVGTYGGLSLGLGIVVGTLAGGLIVNALRKRNRLWEFWYPALAAGLSVPLLGGFYLATDTGQAYMLLFLAFFFAGSAFAPALACMLVVSEPAMRGTMVALNVLAASVIAYAAAPAYIGFASDFLIARGFEEATGESLRYALLSSLVLPLFGVIAFVRASRTAAADAVS
jgi:MFS family permease